MIDRITRHIGVLLVFLALSLLWLRPLPIHFASRFAGEIDVWIQAWNQWWMDKALLELHVNPWATDYAFHPTGVELYFHAFSPLNSLLAVPLRHLCGPVVALNLIFLATFVLSGYGAYLLAHRLTGSTPAGFVAGYIYAFSPYHFDRVNQLEHATIQWLPFLLLALWRLTETRAKRWGAAVAGAFLLIFYSNIYYGLSAGLLLGLYFLGDLVVSRRAAGRRAWITSWLTVFLGIACGTGLFLREVLRVAAQPGRFHVPLWVNARQSLDLLAFFTPAPGNPLFASCPLIARLNESFTGWETTGYLGFSVIALAAWGLWRSASPRRWSLLALAGFFLVLSLGPVLHVAGRVIGGDGWLVVLPQALLQKAPFIGAARVPARYIAVAMLPLAVLAGMGTAQLAAGRRRRLLVPLLALLVLEYWTAPLVTSPARTPDYCGLIAADDADCAVLDLPIRLDEDPAEWWRAFDPDPRGWYQVRHGKKSFTGPISHTALTARHYRFLLDSPLLGPLVRFGLPRGALPRAAALAEMKKLRLKYIVLQRYLYDRMDSAEMERDRRLLAEEWGLQLLREDADVLVFRAFDGDTAAAFPLANSGHTP